MHFREIGIPSVDSDMKVRKDSFERYCSGRGLNPSEVMSEFKILSQRMIPARATGTVFAHPNVPQRYALYVDGIGAQGQYTSAFVVDAKNGSLDNVVAAENMVGRIPLGMLLTVSPVTVEDIGRIVQFYTKIHSLPKFQDGFVYMMEFTFDPLYVLQMRKFRKIEDGSSLQCSWREEEGVLKTDLTFGLTPPEGLIFPYLDAQMLIGIPQRMDWANGEFFDLAAKHNEGFVYRGGDDYHTNVVLPHARVTLGDFFCHSFHHGTLANMAHMPLYFSGMKHQVDAANIPPETLVRVFSKGDEGYLKIES